MATDNTPDKKLTLSKEEEAQLKKRYDELGKDEDVEITFEQFAALQVAENQRLADLANGRATTYKPKPSPRMTPCGNGNFDSTIDANEWQGAYGIIPETPSSNYHYLDPNDPFSTLSEGLLNNVVNDNINNSNVHHTPVTSGIDPIVTTSNGAPNDLRNLCKTHSLIPFCETIA